MTVSVLMPVYNTNPEHLKLSIDSVLGQTYQDFEFVIVNNGSTNEETVSVLKQIESNEKVKIVDCPQQENKKNLSVALNHGLLHCSHELVARIDSDDTMQPHRLQMQVDFMKTNENVVVCGGQMQHMGDELVTSLTEEIDEFYYFHDTHIVNHPTVMFRKSSILSIGGYVETPDHIPEDFLLWVKVLRNGWKIRNLQDIIVNYRESNTESLSHTDSKHENWNKAIQSVIYN